MALSFKSCGTIVAAVLLFFCSVLQRKMMSAFIVTVGQAYYCCCYTVIVYFYFQLYSEFTEDDEWHCYFTLLFFVTFVFYQYQYVRFYISGIESTTEGLFLLLFCMVCTFC